MRILVCGGRNFSDRALLEATLDRLHDVHIFAVLIEGDAYGADRMAEEWAQAQDIGHAVFKADWMGSAPRLGRPQSCRRWRRAGRTWSLHLPAAVAPTT